jgi:hypothetical protein
VRALWITIILLNILVMLVVVIHDSQAIIWRQRLSVMSVHLRSSTRIWNLRAIASAVHDTGNMLLRAALVSNDFNRTISKRWENRLGVHGTLRLFLVVPILLLLLADCVSLAASRVIRHARWLSVIAADGLLRAAVTDHQWIIISQQLVIIDCSIGGHPRVVAVTAAWQILLLLGIRHRLRRRVYHVVLRLSTASYVRAVFHIMLISWRVRMTAVSWACVLPLSHTLWVAHRAMMIVVIPAIIEAVRWVLLLPLWIVLVMASSTASGHGLICYAIAWVSYLMACVHVLGSWTWAIGASRDDTIVDVVTRWRVHLLLTTGSTMVRGARVGASADGRGGCRIFIVASRWLGVTAARRLDSLIPTVLIRGTTGGLSGEFARFGVDARSTIVADVVVAWIVLMRVGSIITILVSSLAVFGDQVVVAGWVAATIQLLLVTQLLLLGRVHDVMATRSRAMTSEASGSHACILILVVCSTGAESTRRGAFSLVSRAIVYFLSLNQLTVATLSTRADEAPVGMSCRACREHAVIYLAVILLISMVRWRRYLILGSNSTRRFSASRLRHILLWQLRQSVRAARWLRVIRFLGWINAVIRWLLVQMWRAVAGSAGRLVLLACAAWWAHLRAAAPRLIGATWEVAASSTALLGLLTGADASLARRRGGFGIRLLGVFNHEIVPLDEWGMLISNLITVFCAAWVFVATWHILRMSDLKISLRLTSRALLFLTWWVPRRGAPITRNRLLLTRFVLLARRPGTVWPRSN